MKVLLQPSSGKEATKHFDDTIDSGVLLTSLKGRIDDESYNKLEQLNQKNVKVWGFVPSEKTGSRSEWENLREDDLVLFYAKKKFFYIAKVLLKIRNRKLAEEWWTTDEKGRTWEFIYFIKEGKQIEVPYDPEILKKIDGEKYNPNHVVQGANLLNIENSANMFNYIERYEVDLVDEETLSPTKEEEKKIFQFSLGIHTQEEAIRKIGEITKQVENKPVKERIRIAKSLVRNPKFARLVKEKNLFICEICGQKPFTQKNGLFYAEAHHKFELAKTRIDSPEDMICLCPTCHRVLHFGNDESLKNRKKDNT